MQVGKVFIRGLFGLLILVHLVGCASTRYIPSQERTKPTLTSQYFIADDATKLPLQVWTPPHRVQTQLVLLHGFNEYAGAFERVGQYFASQGVKVWAYDQRGFGRGEQRGLWAGGERMAQDARQFVQLVHAQAPDQPLFLLGTSMGGAVALKATSNDPNLPLKGVILEAPAVWTRATQPFYQRWSLAIARQVAPHWSPSGNSLKIRASDNDAMLREIWQSPYMIRKSRIDTVAGLVDLMDMAYRAAHNLSYPTLVLYGLKDQVIPQKPIMRLRQRLPTLKGSEYKEYTHGWHMLVRDLQGKRVMDDSLQWMSGVVQQNL
ncbi:MAG: lysophospholipase [Thiofilum sp.]|uniref:alpha/beta hydrolase n=1 Tax=Thiofilum sp. TaxID=2212733 RepID=UPI0025FEDF53|nr:alpha/beta hydrolase [Thiofilum sp.]MBK8454072.1 alpha/beta hydrolase [Thiofilum sp.]